MNLFISASKPFWSKQSSANKNQISFHLLGEHHHGIEHSPDDHGHIFHENDNASDSSDSDSSSSPPRNRRRRRRPNRPKYNVHSNPVINQNPISNDNPELYHDSGMLSNPQLHHDSGIHTLIEMVREF